MDLGLSQRVALVTGASSGLGLAIARALAAEGCAVAMVARRKDVLEREARDIVAESKGRALPLVADVTRPDDVVHVTSQAAALLGPIDILVANAGGPPSTTFTTTTDEQLQSALELNLLASIRLARAVVPGMRERRWGRVIFVSSMAAKQPLGGLLLSNTARAGLLGFAKTIASECAPDNVLVNTVLPGHFDTDRTVGPPRGIRFRSRISRERARELHHWSRVADRRRPDRRADLISQRLQASIAPGGMSPFRPIGMRTAGSHPQLHLNADKE